MPYTLPGNGSIPLPATFIPIKGHQMIHAITSLRVKSGRAEDLLEAFRTYAVGVRKEREYIRYIAALEVDTAFAPQPVDKDMARIIKTWEGFDALSDHIVALEKSAYREKRQDLIEDRPIKVLREA
jgi:quinol monooxygenase YgiN